MEGPSILLLREQTAKFLGKKVLDAAGAVRTIDPSSLAGQKLTSIGSWGKHYLLTFSRVVVRVHFLMFGSYWLGGTRPDAVPKLSLTFRNGFIHFYSCSVRYLEAPPEELYDWRVDVSAQDWDPRFVLRKLRAMPDERLCDVLLDQNCFAGAGNIFKNEVLFRLHLHPLLPVRDLSAAEQRRLVQEMRTAVIRILLVRNGE